MAAARKKCDQLLLDINKAQRSLQRTKALYNPEEGHDTLFGRGADQQLQKVLPKGAREYTFRRMANMLSRGNGTAAFIVGVSIKPRYHEDEFAELMMMYNSNSNSNNNNRSRTDSRGLPFQAVGVKVTLFDPKKPQDAARLTQMWNNRRNRRDIEFDVDYIDRKKRYYMVESDLTATRVYEYINLEGQVSDHHHLGHAFYGRYVYILYDC